jgi:hypothetical protein
MSPSKNLRAPSSQSGSPVAKVQAQTSSHSRDRFLQRDIEKYLRQPRTSTGVL